MKRNHVKLDYVKMLFIQLQKNVQNIKMYVYQMEMNVFIIYNHVHHIKVIKKSVKNILELMVNVQKVLMVFVH
jgi:hypothetical protein